MKRRGFLKGLLGTITAAAGLKASKDYTKDTRFLGPNVVSDPRLMQGATDGSPWATRVDGCIAQEVAEVTPHAVKGKIASYFQPDHSPKEANVGDIWFDTNSEQRQLYRCDRRNTIFEQAHWVPVDHVDSETIKYPPRAIYNKHNRRRDV